MTTHNFNGVTITPKASHTIGQLSLWNGNMKTHPPVNTSFKYYNFHDEIIGIFAPSGGGKSTLITNLANNRTERIYLGGLHPNWKNLVSDPGNNVKGYIGSDCRDYQKISGTRSKTILLVDDPIDTLQCLNSLKEAMMLIAVANGTTYFTTTYPEVLRYVARLFIPGSNSLIVQNYLDSIRVTDESKIIGFLYPEFLDDLAEMQAEDKDKKPLNSVTPICKNCKHYMFLELSCELDRSKFNLSSKATCPKFDPA